MSANVHLKSRMSELCTFEVTRGKGWYETPNILLIFGDRGTPEWDESIPEAAQARREPAFILVDAVKFPPGRCDDFLVVSPAHEPP